MRGAAGARAPSLETVVSSVLALLDCARLEIDRNGEAARASLDQAAVLLLGEIRRRPVKALKTRSDRSLTENQARKVRQYIDDQLGHRILVSDLGALASCSAGHFARAFKGTFGTTPHAYLTRRRLERACFLMVTSRAPLSDIALACGLTDQPHLCKVFREILGKTPAVWRRERRENLA